ncbi:MAG: hypothetical protein EPN25_12260 [Nitrospirae bacterium]|nr:MAG: hypothetical protein EPN25_12260 [Nitrospirota bacterium]
MKDLLSILPVLLVLLSVAVSSAEQARIITKENALREDCRFFSPLKKKVRLNDLIEITSKEGDWLRAKHKGTAGCIHKSAVDEKNLDISGVSGSKSHSASGSEVALAGKGFNPQVEKTFKEKHPDLDFKAIDAIEASHPSDESIRKFISSGALNQP